MQARSINIGLKRAISYIFFFILAADCEKEKGQSTGFNIESEASTGYGVYTIIKLTLWGCTLVHADT